MLFCSYLTCFLDPVTSRLVFAVNALAVGNGVLYNVNIILNLFYSFIIILLFCVNLLNMLTKREFKLEMFVVVCWSYTKWCISILRGTILLVDHFVIKVWILAVPYKLTPSSVEIFSSLKNRLVRCNLRCDRYFAYFS